MKLKNKIGNLVDIDWANLQELQPDNIKVPINTEYLKQSLLNHGFTLPFAVWNNDGQYFCIDGHTRKEVLNELIADGVDVPKNLKAFEVLAKNRQEAIKILIEVYNQKHNPFAGEILTEWLELEEIELQEIKLESVNVMNADEVSLSEEFNEDFDLPDGDRELFQQITFTLSDEQAEFIKNAINEIKQDAGFNSVETYGNENNNGNALYLIMQQWAEQKKL